MLEGRTKCTNLSYDATILRISLVHRLAIIRVISNEGHCLLPCPYGAGRAGQQL